MRLIGGGGAGGGGGGGTVACKRKDDPRSPDHVPQPKKPRLVFTDLQRRTLQAIFKVCRINSISSNFDMKPILGNKATVQRNGCHYRSSALSPSYNSWKFLYELTSSLFG